MGRFHHPHAAHALVVFMLALFIAMPAAHGATHNILDYGAVPDDTGDAASAANSAAIAAALLAAHGEPRAPMGRASGPGEREVLVPAGHAFSVFNTTLSNLVDVTLRIEGELHASEHREAWSLPNDLHQALLHIRDSQGVTVCGGGLVHGHGYAWWWSVILTGKGHRPLMFFFERTSDLVIKDLLLRDSPSWHVRMNDVLRVHVSNVEVRVDVNKQRNMFEKAGKWDGLLALPTFPLNTDGFDPSGRDILIENITVTNYDDVVAVKGLDGNGMLSQCSENITVRNAHVTLGVGMTIGTLVPHPAHSCIRNVTFEDIEFHNAIKALYVKTNPSDTGTGEITNIEYRNIRAHGSLWYPIWIGPNQQKQPGKAGTGCSWLFPLDRTCPTQPRITIDGIAIRNATFDHTVTLPGVILCNATNPCRNIVFENVTNTGINLLSHDYSVTHADVRNVGVNSPPIKCGDCAGDRDLSTSMPEPVRVTPQRRAAPLQ